MNWLPIIILVVFFILLAIVAWLARKVNAHTVKEAVEAQHLKDTADALLSKVMDAEALRASTLMDYDTWRRTHPLSGPRGGGAVAGGDPVRSGAPGVHDVRGTSETPSHDV